MSGNDLINELKVIVGTDAVVADEQELLVYECDAYTLQKNLPTAVVLPATTEEVVAVVKLCKRLQLPIIPRGAGTSLSGAVLAVDGGVMIALTRMNRVLNIDARNRRAPARSGGEGRPFGRSPAWLFVSRRWLYLPQRNCPSESCFLPNLTTGWVFQGHSEIS